MTVDVRAYPLAWPAGRPRTAEWKRVRARFKGWTFPRARADLYDELGRLDATHYVLSTDLELRLDGEAYARATARDSGVALYFRRLDVNGHHRPYVMAADRYDRMADNVRALSVCIEALRRIERHGSPDLMEQAFSGFTAIPETTGGTHTPWDEVLGMSSTWRNRPASQVLVEVKRCYRELVKEHSRAFTLASTGEESDLVRGIIEARDVALDQLTALGDQPW